MHQTEEELFSIRRSMSKDRQTDRHGIYIVAKWTGYCVAIIASSAL